MNIFKKFYMFLLKPIYVQLQEQNRSAEEIAGKLERLEDAVGMIKGVISNYDDMVHCTDQNTAHIRDLTVTMSAIKKSTESNSSEIVRNAERTNAFTARLELVGKEMEALSNGCRKIEKGMEEYEALEERIAQNAKDIVRVINTINRYHDNAYLNTMDYLQFENRFRGAREKVMKSQEQYVRYFRGKCNVVDIGCGRGEFLELLAAEKIPAVGVDLNETFIGLCQSRGLQAVCGDAIKYIREMPKKTDGIFCSQMAEHLSKAKLLELCRTCYNRMEEGAYVVFETPNASSLVTMAQGFYIDPTHDKPVHYELFRYFLEISGFKDIEIIFTEESKAGLPRIPHIQGGEHCRNAAEINDAITEVNKLLFGSQDYAIIARR